MRIVYPLFFWFGVLLAGLNFGGFVAGVFQGYPLPQVLFNYFACIYLLHCLKSEVMWQEERRRLESIARDRGYLD